MLKTTLKLTLIITLFSMTAFADGQQTNGGKSDGSNGNGLVCAECVTTQVDTKLDADKSSDSADSDDSIMEFIQQFFTKLIG